MENPEYRPKKILPMSQSAREAYNRADEYTKSSGNRYIGVRQIFYGLMSGEQDDPYKNLLVSRGITAGAIDAITPRGESVVHNDAPSPGSPAVRLFMEEASSYAIQSGRETIDPADLWKVLFKKTYGEMGSTKIKTSLGAVMERIVTELGVDSEDLIAEFDKLEK